MAQGLRNASNHAIDEEAKAEVDVLNSRLDRTTQLTKKIQACLGRLSASSKSVNEVAGPLSSETKRLQLLGNNVDAILAEISRIRQPVDSKANEEQIIQVGPEKAGLSNYLSSLKRLKQSLDEIQASSMRANQHTMTDLTRLIKTGIVKLESRYEDILRTETPRSIEPLHFITKEKPFPALAQDMITRLGLINTHVKNFQLHDDRKLSLSTLYADIRGPYLSSSLANLAAASVTTAKKKNPGATYRTGTNGMGIYAKAMEGMFMTEHDNICNIFTREEWSSTFQSTCQAALTELARTIRELNAHIKAHLTTDCYLAYEITEIISEMSEKFSARTGELKASLSTAVKPVRETAKLSLSELLEDTRRKVGSLTSLPSDGDTAVVVLETMKRLQIMVDFLRPISSIMISLGDGGWKASSASNGRLADAIPSLASFDVGADGRDIFAHYCLDTVEILISSLEQKARALLRSKSVIGVFIANCVVVTERMVRNSNLCPLLETRLDVLEPWRKKATALYTDVFRDISPFLFDAIHTNRTQRPTSGQIDSASIIKGLSSKDKEKIKEKFSQFNSAFDDMVSKHRSYQMEPEVRLMFGKDIRSTLQVLYDRFWDRYHEIDKGKGKYVKYDKSTIAAVFMSLDK